MNLEKQFAKSMAHFATVEEWQGYKRGVQDVCSVAQPMLDDMLEVLRGLVAEYLPDVGANFEYLSTEGNDAQLEQAECDLRKWQAASLAIAKATGDTQ